MKTLCGFTLTELLIAMFLGLLMLGMTLSIFNSLNNSIRQTQQLSELQQNAQLIYSLFQNEFSNVGFWGGRSEPDLASIHTAIRAPSSDCVHHDADSGSFPVIGQYFIQIYAEKSQSVQNLKCLSNVISQSEAIQIKRLIGQKTSLSQMRANRFYYETNWHHSRFVSIDSTGLHESYDYYPYQHVVFYLQEQRVDKQTIPVLMRKRLTRNTSGMATMSTDSIVDGVERMQFEFGIDTTLNGQLNHFLSLDEMPLQFWQQKTSRIISIRYYVLLRAISADPSYINNKRYEMGNVVFVAPSDNYRRLLISSHVYLPNAVLGSSL